MSSAPIAAGAPLPVPDPAPLARSLFAHDPGGQLDEDDLQKILAAPIEIALPARIGVLPVATATDWRGPSPDYAAAVPPGVAPLVERLRHDTQFTLVTEMMPIPSGALGMEALREAAARYRLRYVMLYREVLIRDNTFNPWAWAYVTGVGALFAPGQHHEVYGYLEATMFDVKTGLLMFTTRRAITGSQTTNVWHQDEKLGRLTDALIRKYAPELGGDALTDLHRFADAVAAETHGGPGAVVGSAPARP